jgi:hypothetical protein
MRYGLLVSATHTCFLGVGCVCMDGHGLSPSRAPMGLHPMLDIAPRWGWVLCLGSFWGLFLLGVIGGVIGGVI